MMSWGRTPRGREPAALGRATRTSPMLPASKTAWARAADGLAVRPPGRRDSPGAAETRRLASRAREIVTSAITSGHGRRELMRAMRRDSVSLRADELVDAVLELNERQQPHVAETDPHREAVGEGVR